MSDVSFFCREHDAGEVVDIAWARTGDIHRGQFRLDPRDTRVFEHTA